MKKQLEPDYTIKFIVVGDSNVGKSCLVRKYTHDHWSPEQDPTIGVDIGFKTIQLADKKVKVAIYDLGGHKNFKSITETYYKGTAGILLCYAVDDPKSFKRMSVWLADLLPMIHPQTVISLVATKKDTGTKFSSETVLKESGEWFKNNHSRIDYFIETSAKTGENIELIFELMVGHILAKVSCGMIPYEQLMEIGIRLDAERAKKYQRDHRIANGKFECCSIQ